FRRLVPWLGTSAITLAALLVVAGSAAAQQHNRRGGASSGVSDWSGGQPGYNNGHDSPYFGRYYGDSYNPNYRQYYGSRYAPDAYGQDAYFDDGRMAASALEDENAVRITVRVSPGAEVWFDG